MPWDHQLEPLKFLSYENKVQIQLGEFFLMSLSGTKKKSHVAWGWAHRKRSKLNVKIWGAHLLLIMYSNSRIMIPNYVENFQHRNCLDTVSSSLPNQTPGCVTLRWWSYSQLALGTGIIFAQYEKTPRKPYGRCPDKDSKPLGPVKGVHRYRKEPF